MKTVKNEKREIIKIEQKGKKTIYKVNFIYETIFYIFGKLKKKVKTVQDVMTFDTYVAAQDYIENVEKPSIPDLIYIYIFPKNYKLLQNKVDFKWYSGLERYGAFIPWDCIYSSQTLKDIVKHTQEHLAKNETIVTSYNCSNAGMYEVEKLEEKRNDLIDNEIKRTEEYIKFLKTLKK